MTIMGTVSTMKIIEPRPRLTFKRPHTKRQLTRRIIVHHTAGADNSVAEIHQMHINRGWTGIGYHYIIRANGQIERGRPEVVRGAHAGDANVDSIGISLTGNFETRVPTASQMDALAWLIGDIRRRMGQQVTVVRHRDVAATACPGNLFPWDELQRRLSVIEVDAVTQVEQETRKVVPQPIPITLSTYTVGRGDTLWAISQRFSVSVAILRQWNNLKTDTLQIGQRLRVSQ